MNIIDFLNEEKGEGILYHYTNSFNIIDILNSREGKYLKTKEYVGDKRDVKSLATVRPSMIKDVETLSDEIGKIRFVFDISSLTSGRLRNVKISKVAEFPIGHINDLKSFFTTKEFYKNLEMFKEMGKLKYKEYLKTKKFTRNDIIWIITTFEEFKENIKKREGEERISINPKSSALSFYKKERRKGLSKKETFKKLLNRKNIPLDPSLMKIEILSGFQKEVERMENANYKGYTKQTLKDLIRKNKKLFIINSEYRKFMA